MVYISQRLPKENFKSRLNNCTMEQLKNKVKTGEKQIKDPAINKWNNNCSLTGGRVRQTKVAACYSL